MNRATGPQAENRDLDRRMKEDHEGHRREHRAGGEVERWAGSKARLKAERDADRRRQHQRHRAQLRQPGLEHELRSREHRRP